MLVEVVERTGLRALEFVVGYPMDNVFCTMNAKVEEGSPGVASRMGKKFIEDRRSDVLPFLN